MFAFKDPKEFELAVPPVPDVKAWLEEFRITHPNNNNNNKCSDYESQISLLNDNKNNMLLEFETMKKSNNDIYKKYNDLKLHSELLKNELLQIKSQNRELISQNKQLISQNEEYKKEINNKENVNNVNQVKWNFNDDNNNNQRISRKRRRSNEEHDEIISQSSSAIKKLKISHSNSMYSNQSNSRSTSTTTTATSQTTSTLNNINDNQFENSKLLFDGIFEKKVSAQFDLIRGDILAEAGYNDQVIYSLNLLKKCTSDQWQARNFLMEIIGGLVEENKGIDDKIIYDNREIIRKQLTDLRSAIVKTACELILTFSKYLGYKFGSSLAYFIPIHLAGLYVTIAIIRDSHNYCLTECVTNTHSFKCITPLLRGLQNKHSEVRVKVIKLLTKLIIYFGKNNVNTTKNMDKYTDAIGNTIKTYISDANPSVRNSVKILFENFDKYFPKKSDKLLNKLSSHHVKTLKKSINNNNNNTKKKKVVKSSVYAQTRTRRKGK